MIKLKDIYSDIAFATGVEREIVRKVLLAAAYQGSGVDYNALAIVEVLNTIASHLQQIEMNTRPITRG